MKYIIYSTIDGDIRCNVSCTTEDIEFNCRENETWMEHEWVDDSKYKVDLATLEVVPIVAEDGAT